MNNPDVILVTPNDEVLGLIDKITAHKHAMLHRAFSVFIYRFHQGHVEILLQQRQLTKYHCGGLWTNACCSHPLPSESVETAASRRLMEEMGIQTDLTLLGRFHYVAVLDHGFYENELDYVLIGSSQEESVAFNPDEVYATLWIRLDSLDDWLQDKPQDFTPWFVKALNICKDHLTNLKG